MWRWAKLTKIFEPTENLYWSRAGKKLKSHNRVVRAGLNPFDWMELMSGEGKVLHRIVLNPKQAEFCVVAEGSFRPTEEEITEFIERKGIPLIGSLRRYEEEKYEKSFVPLLEYEGGYNLPEVLIPFPVKGEAVSWKKLWMLIWRLKMWFARKISRKLRGSGNTDYLGGLHKLIHVF